MVVFGQDKKMGAAFLKFQAGGRRYESGAISVSYTHLTDKVKGFTVGGDDYIVKPFSLVELEARVRAHLRREARHR